LRTNREHKAPRSPPHFGGAEAFVIQGIRKSVHKTYPPRNIMKATIARNRT
jgi:hypothetical protein